MFDDKTKLPYNAKTKTGVLKVQFVTYWFVGGLYHRLDGPAVIYKEASNGTWNCLWFYYGNQVSEEYILNKAANRKNMDAVRSILWKKYLSE